MMPHAPGGKPALATGSAPTPPAPNPEVAPPVWLLALLVAIASVGPMSLNIVTPALPGIALALRSDVETVQLALSLYLVTMGISQLVLGTLADRLGRRPVLIGGFMLAVVASLAAIWAGSISALVVARVLQAFGASAGIVMSRAIIRDLYDRERAASMIGWVTMAIMVVPMIVPPLGGFLDTEFGWPSIFICIAAFAATVLTLVCIALPETLAPGHDGGAARFLEELMSLLLSRPFVCYVVCAATGSALFFAFLGGAPHIVVTQMGRSAFELGLWFTTVSFAYMLGNFCAARFSVRLGVPTMILAGTLVGIVGGLAIVLMVLFTPQLGPIIIFLPEWITAFSNGLLLPNAIAGAISVRPQAAGAASGIVGFVQMAVGASAAQWVGHLLTTSSTADPLAWVLFGFALACAIGYAGLVWRPQTTT